MTKQTFIQYQKANCTEHRLTDLLGGGYVCVLCWTMFQCPDCGDFTPVTTDCCGKIVCECHVGYDRVDGTIAVCLAGHGCAEKPPNGGVWADDPWLEA